jgi:hypothetical protein
MIDEIERVTGWAELFRLYILHICWCCNHVAESSNELTPFLSLLSLFAVAGHV